MINSSMSSFPLRKNVEFPERLKKIKDNPHQKSLLETMTAHYYSDLTSINLLQYIVAVNKCQQY